MIHTYPHTHTHTNSECRRIFHHLHNVNNQRSDRMSMAWGVEARVPFLDPDVIDAVMKVRVLREREREREKERETETEMSVQRLCVC
jgi:asparagine synthase (glutamine-hydrolysing)